MDSKIRAALENDRLCDISMTGRKTGQIYRFEIWFHHVEGQIYLTGRPGPRQWLKNMQVNPAITFHLKERVLADLPARATPIPEPGGRRECLSRLLRETEY